MGGGWLALGIGLRCTVCTCMHMEKFLPLYPWDLDTSDQYQNIIPIYLILELTDSISNKELNSWYYFCNKKKSNRVVHVFLLEDGVFP